MAKDQYNDPKKPNIKALVQFMLKGKPVKAGTVLRKQDFQQNNDWKNLCHMTPARCEETADKVGEPTAKKAEKKTKAPG